MSVHNFFRKTSTFIMVICLIVAALAGPVAAEPESEPNDNFYLANPISPTDSTAGQIIYGDNDVYAIDVNQESITIETDVGSGTDIHVFVYDPNGNTIKSWVQAGGSERDVYISTPEDGIYYVHIQSAQYNNVVTNYTVAVSEVPYEMPWDAIGVLFSIFTGVVIGVVGLFKLVQRRKGKPVSASATSKV